MRRIRVKLNQQQLELIDRAIAAGVAPDRNSLIRKALREHAVNAGWKGNATHEGSKP